MNTPHPALDPVTCALIAVIPDDTFAQIKLLEILFSEIRRGVDTPGDGQLARMADQCDTLTDLSWDTMKAVRDFGYPCAAFVLMLVKAMANGPEEENP